MLKQIVLVILLNLFFADSAVSPEINYNEDFVLLNLKFFITYLEICPKFYSSKVCAVFE